MVDFFIGFAFDFVRAVRFIGSMVYGFYNFLMVFSTASKYSQILQKWEYLDLQPDTTTSIRTACNIAFYTFLCAWGFSIAHSLYYYHQSPLMRYFHSLSAQ